MDREALSRVAKLAAELEGNSKYAVAAEIAHELFLRMAEATEDLDDEGEEDAEHLI